MIQDERLIQESEWGTGAARNLCGRAWLPVDRQPHGCVVVVHGLGEHGQRYQGLAHTLAAAGWGCVAIDLPGHGRSPGRRGHIPRYPRLLADIGSLLDDAARLCPDQPLFLLGHSMGGNLAVNYSLHRHRVAPASAVPTGLVLSAPMFLPENPPPRSHVLAAWLGGQIAPWLSVRSPVKPQGLTSDTAVIEANRKDPLMHKRLSLYLASQLLAQGRYALDHAGELDLPTLLLHGDADPITSARASESFADRAGGRAQCVIFPGLLHEIFHEMQRPQVISVLTKWLQHQADAASAPTTDSCAVATAPNSVAAGT